MRGSVSFSTIRRFLPYLWPKGDPGTRSRVVLASLLVLLAKAITLVVPFAYKAIVDGMAAQATAGLILAFALAYVAARFGSTLFDNLRNSIFEIVGQRAVASLSADVFDHVHRLGLRFHLGRNSGALTRVVERGTKSVSGMLYFILFNIAPTAVEFIAVSIIFFLKLGIWFVLATAVMMAVYIIFTQRVTERRAAIRREMLERDNEAANRALDSLINYETVKYFGAEAMESARYRSAVDLYARAATRNAQSLGLLNIGQSLVTSLMIGLALFATIKGWSEGRFTIGDVVLVNTLLLQMFAPLDMLGAVYREIKQGLVDMEQMFALIDTVPEVADAPGAPPLRVGEGHVRFSAVDFAYEPDRQILSSVDFDVAPGSTLGIVGHSGAGKSTIARLLYRLYDVTGGSVTIDGQDVRSVGQASLRQNIGIVPQDTVLFNDTIAYNIGFGRPGASAGEIEAAARAAALHDFIRSLPDGYETRVGERGLKLSGGEKQRVAIARTLLKNPPILVLDEATSALDSKTEASIQKALAALSLQRTTIVIAHRLSTIVGADWIIVIEAGRIVERGTHRALLRLGGVYAALWSEQARSRRRGEEPAD
ncbi:MAG TPA: ABC transporter ATP-binding protein/permease [Allosphingosinicella sp.]|nr:ABC transporter ATP-binding protein/permease [Allosphingosinicella sp.]